jgi:hypothetical protein
MPKSLPLFTIKIEVPSSRKGHISIPLLLKICADAQNAVLAQAGSIEGTEQITLELMGLRKGSTQLDFAGAPSPQMQLGYMEELSPAAGQAVEEIADALTGANRNRSEWGKAVAPEAIEALDDMADVLDEGVVKFEWIFRLPGNNTRRKTAQLTRTTQERIKARRDELVSEKRSLTTPLRQAVALSESFFEGTLEMADGKCRINPPIGNPVTVTFGAEQLEKVLEARHRPVRVKVDQQSRKLVDLSVSDEGDVDRSLFFKSKTIEELIAEQGVTAVSNLESFSGAIPDEDIDEFLSDIYSDRIGAIG